MMGKMQEKGAPSPGPGRPEVPTGDRNCQTLTLSIVKSQPARTPTVSSSVKIPQFFLYIFLKPLFELLSLYYEFAAWGHLYLLSKDLKKVTFTATSIIMLY